jgi:hypothetical protein
MTFTGEIFATPELQKCNVYFHDMDFFTKIFLMIQLTGICVDAQILATLAIENEACLCGPLTIRFFYKRHDARHYSMKFAFLKLNAALCIH